MKFLAQPTRKRKAPTSPTFLHTNPTTTKTSFNLSAVVRVPGKTVGWFEQTKEDYDNAFAQVHNGGIVESAKVDQIQLTEINYLVSLQKSQLSPKLGNESPSENLSDEDPLATAYQHPRYDRFSLLARESQYASEDQKRAAATAVLKQRWPQQAQVAQQQQLMQLAVQAAQQTPLGLKQRPSKRQRLTTQQPEERPSVQPVPQQPEKPQPSFFDELQKLHPYLGNQQSAIKPASENPSLQAWIAEKFAQDDAAAAKAARNQSAFYTRR